MDRLSVFDLLDKADLVVKSFTICEQDQGQLIRLTAALKAAQTMADELSTLKSYDKAAENHSFLVERLFGELGQALLTCRRLGNR